MQEIDYTGTLLAVLISAFIAAIGKGLDSLLLGRHIAALDLLALRFLVFLQEQQEKNIPRTTLTLYLNLKDKFLGDVHSPRFYIRLLIISAFMTFMLVPLGAGLGWMLFITCDQTTSSLDMSAVFHQALSNMSLLLPLIPLNYFFDLVSTVVTIWLITKAVEAFRYKLYLIVVFDLLVCVALMANLFFLMGEVKPSHEIDTLPYFSFMVSLFGMTIAPECGTFNFLTQKALLSFTILIPTALYLATTIAFLALYEAYRINRFVLSYLLEKSIEESNKSFFSIIGIAVGLVGITAKFVLELSKLF